MKENYLSLSCFARRPNMIDVAADVATHDIGAIELNPSKHEWSKASIAIPAKTYCIIR